MSECTRRQQIRDMLQLLASAEEQLLYERNVPHVDITAELVCMWFDDLFHGDAPNAEPGFTMEEHAALEEFHRIYDARVRHLPESRGTVRTWLEAPVWREVMQAAHNTLGRITA